MRVLAALFIFVLGINYLGIRGVEGNNIRFSLKGATSKTYRDFINAIRDRLTAGNAYGIPTLNERVPDSERFLLVDLSNYDDETITVAIDVVNVYVVGYRVDDHSFFLGQEEGRNVPPIDQLFTDVTDGHRHTFSFSGNYIHLEGAANQRRERIPLGISALDNSITRMRTRVHGNNNRAVAESFLVIIQMISEAARFRLIESQIRLHMDRGQDFEPGIALLSLQNQWSSLSTEIQQATLQGGLFSQSVQLRSINNNPIIVDSVASPVVAGIALLLFHCISPIRPLAAATTTTTTTSGMEIRMHVKNDNDDDNNDVCVVRDRTTHISGPDGLCVDVRDGQDNDGNPIQLWTCEQQKCKQRWTFHTDGTIRSLGKCMTTNGNSPENYVMIYDCDWAVLDNSKWALSTDGTITNIHSGLVLTATDITQGSTLSVRTNTHGTNQGWRVGGEVQPTTMSFMTGYNDACLVAVNTHMLTAECVPCKPRQQWALYTDGTIRVDNNRSLCVTADHQSTSTSTSSLVIISRCNWSPSQRWVFNTDGSILNPSTELVMEVSDSLQPIILNQPTGYANQKWLASF